ncbi:MAG: metallophosphoesterase [Actinomycetaceae bacterium]|nr:metallophosphoesterase [Actinomycetaceae bacterium]
MDDFSIIVWPDTQYLFDGERTHPEFITESIRALDGDSAVVNPQLIIHVGDVVEHGYQDELDTALDAFDYRDTRFANLPQLWISGNHDVDHSSDDQRGTTPFRESFGPAASERFNLNGIIFDETGYSWIYTLDSRLQVIGIGWGARSSTLEWACQQAESTMPTIVVSHDLVFNSELTENGRRVWDALIEQIPGVFLALAGHEWPSSRVRQQTRDGRWVECHCFNAQDLVAGGAGMVRTYTFRRGICDVRTWCPALTTDERLKRNLAARRQLAVADEANQLRFVPALPVTSGIELGRPDFAFYGGECRTVEMAPASRMIMRLRFTAPNQGRDWQVLFAKWGQAPDGSNEPLLQVSLSSERFVGFHAFTTAGQEWVTSHAIDDGSTNEVVISLGGYRAGHRLKPGVWLNGDRILRSTLTQSTQLIESDSTTWSIGCGQWGDEMADRFYGTIESIEIWNLEP